MSSEFNHMITYLDNPHIPHSGKMENLTVMWRQMEKGRYGFRTERGRQNHLKLYQIRNYLKVNLAEKSGKLTTS